MPPKLTSKRSVDEVTANERGNGKVAKSAQKNSESGKGKGKGKGVDGPGRVKGGKGVGHVENMLSANEQCTGKIRKISDIITMSRPNDKKIASVIAGSASCLSSVQDKLRFLQQAETLVTSALFPKNGKRTTGDTATDADSDEGDDSSELSVLSSVQDDRGTLDAIIAMQALQSTQIAVSEVTLIY